MITIHLQHQQEVGGGGFTSHTSMRLGGVVFSNSNSIHQTTPFTLHLFYSKTTPPSPLELDSSNSNSIHQTTPFTLHLFYSKTTSPSPLELDSSFPLPLGCQKFLDLKTGVVYYKKWWEVEDTKMSGKGKNQKLDLRFNLSPPRANMEVGSPSKSPTPSPPSSCLSSENSESNSPGTTSMMLAGCPRCLMYVMLSHDDPKCPKCKSNVLLDFFHDNNINKTRKK